MISFSIQEWGAWGCQRGVDLQKLAKHPEVAIVVCETYPQRWTLIHKYQPTVITRFPVQRMMTTDFLYNPLEPVMNFESTVSQRKIPKRHIPWQIAPTGRIGDAFSDGRPNLRVSCNESSLITKDLFAQSS